MAKVDFQEIKPKILIALEAKAQMQPFDVTERGFLLIDGFVAQPIQSSVGKEAGYQIGGGGTLPLVMVVGAITGQVYFFPVKVLIPEIEF